MKKLLPLLLLVSCAILSFAKTEIPVMQKVRNKPQQHNQNNNSIEGQQRPLSPLDEPFIPKHVYPGTHISKNVIPIAFGTNDHICSAFRFQKNWVLTAAHCMENAVDSTRNQRIYSSIDKQDNGIVRVVFGMPNIEHPANANVYFYKQGYSSNKDASDGHSDDIALIRLDEVDTSISKAQADMSHAVKQARQAQEQLELFLPKGSPLLDNIKQENKFLQKEQKRLSTKQKDRKDFLNQTLDDYHFFVMNPTQTGELNNRSATIVRFNVQAKGSAERTFPDAFVWKYKGQRRSANHNLGWTFNQADVATSGSPVIVNGYVVSNTSGPHGKDTRETPLYTEQFHQFLVRSMGAEYPQGLCIQPSSTESLPTYETKK